MAVEVDMFRVMNNYVDFSIRRTGHARFRRGPADQSATSTCTSFCSDNQAEQKSFKFAFEECKTADSSISSQVLFIGGEEATVSNRNYSSRKPPLPLSHRKRLREIKQCISTESLIFSETSPATRCYSSGKPSLPSSHRKRRREIEQISGDRLSSQGCHCCKRRKKIEITSRMRISKGSSSRSIPSDDYSWNKYEQKLINGTSSRGGYYKCSSVTGCSARKHVIKDKNDPMALIVTYIGEHNHACLKF